MSFNQNNSKGTFASMHKRKQVELDPSEELICNNCINADLINAKNCRNNACKVSESQMDIQDRLNRATQNNIQSKVQQRIDMSEKVANGMGRLSSMDKERLINSNEKGVFFMNDPNQLSNDLNKQKALNKYNQMSTTGKKTTLSKPGVDDYYKNCVDNYEPPQEKTGKSKRYLQQNYNEELDNQIANNQKLRSKANRNEDARKNEEMEEKDKKFREEQRDEEKRQRLLKEAFLNGNKSLMTIKNQKDQRDRNAETNTEKNKISSLQRQLDDEEKNRKIDEENRKLALQRDLERQIKEKERQKQLDKNRDEPNENRFGGCSCQGTGVCANCKKNYPLSFLNPKRNYAGFGKKGGNNY